MKIKRKDDDMSCNKKESKENFATFKSIWCEAEREQKEKLRKKAEKRAAAIAEKSIAKNEQEDIERNQYWKWLNSIEIVKYIGKKSQHVKHNVKTSGKSMVARSIIGGITFGSAGAVAGAATAKKVIEPENSESQHEFYIKFKNGSSKHMVVSEKTKEYRDLLIKAMK